MTYYFSVILLVCILYRRSSSEEVSSIHPKSPSCACGVPKGGVIIQTITKRFLYVDGAYWCGKTKNLIFVDRYNASFNIYDYETGKVCTTYIQELKSKELSTVIPMQGEKDKFYLMADRYIYILALTGSNSYSLQEISQVISNRNKLFSKGTIDIKKNIILGINLNNYDENAAPQSEFIRVHNKTNFKIIANNYVQADGIAFNKLYTHIYLADAMRNVIYRYDYDSETGDTTNQNLVFNMTDHADCLTGRVTAIIMDTEDYLWISFLKSFTIIKYNLQSKTIERTIGIPVSVVNTLAFGGKNYDILFAGSTQLFLTMDSKAEQASGTIIALSGTGARGWGLPFAKL